MELLFSLARRKEQIDAADRNRKATAYKLKHETFFFYMTNDEHCLSMNEIIKGILMKQPPYLLPFLVFWCRIDNILSVFILCSLL